MKRNSSCSNTGSSGRSLRSRRLPHRLEIVVSRNNSLQLSTQYKNSYSGFTLALRKRSLTIFPLTSSSKVIPRNISRLPPKSTEVYDKLTLSPSTSLRSSRVAWKSAASQAHPGLPGGFRLRRYMAVVQEREEQQGRLRKARQQHDPQDFKMAADHRKYNIG